MENLLQKLHILFLLLFITSTQLSAQNLYIKVMTVSHSDLVFSAKYDINELGYTMYFSKKENLYRVYAGVFHNKREATKALLRVQKYIAKDAFIAEVTLKNNDVTSETIVQPLKIEHIQKSLKNRTNQKLEEKIKILPVKTQKKVKVTDEKKPTVALLERQEELENKEKSNIFLGISLGASLFDVKETTISGSVPLNFRLDERSINYELEVGYYFRDNIFTTLNYQSTNLDNINFTHTFISLNYKFDDIYFISPYVGVLGGYTTMTWKNNPIDTVNTSSSISSFMGGVQIGGEISVYKGISLYGFYRYILIDYTTNLKTNTGQKEIKHSSEQNLNAGIRYRF